MNTANDFNLLAHEWAGLWTETALTILKRAGIRRISVEMEIDVWKTMERMLQVEFKRQASLNCLPVMSLSDLMERVLRKTTLLVAQKFEPQTVSDAFEDRVHRIAEERRETSEKFARRSLRRDSFAQPIQVVAAPRRREWVEVWDTIDTKDI